MPTILIVILAIIAFIVLVDILLSRAPRGREIPGVGFIRDREDK